jgi:hypothetical protein
MMFPLFSELCMVGNEPNMQSVLLYKKGNSKRRYFNTCNVGVTMSHAKANDWMYGCWYLL